MSVILPSIAVIYWRHGSQWSHDNKKIGNIFVLIIALNIMEAVVMLNFPSGQILSGLNGILLAFYIVYKWWNKIEIVNGNMDTKSGWVIPVLYTLWHTELMFTYESPLMKSLSINRGAYVMLNVFVLCTHLGICLIMNNPGLWYQARAIQLTGQFLLGPYGWEKTVGEFLHKGLTHETISVRGFGFQYSCICFLMSLAMIYNASSDEKRTAVEPVYSSKSNEIEIEDLTSRTHE